LDPFNSATDLGSRVAGMLLTGGLGSCSPSSTILQGGQQALEDPEKPWIFLPLENPEITTHP